MSGGHFNYQQHIIHDIATEIETVISENGSTEQNEFGDNIGNHLPDHIIAEFKTAVDLLKKAEIYVQRIDWLLSGDDGEETFIERLKSGFLQTDPYGDVIDKAHEWLQKNGDMYRGDNASDCMVAAFVAGTTVARESCPNCGAPLTYYHESERTRAVCSKKCQGWKVVMEIDHEN